ncbi:MAG TPA: GIY-YIG nuclease family protein [Candidatus Paceibacterota bacterium]
MNKKQLPNNLPDKPGVYFFLDNNKKPIYIGKATSLRDRVRSYFPSTTLGTGRLWESRGPLILDMVFKAKGLKWQETDSVLEALILEANLIKKYQPHYNTKEKDQKSFNYVGITREPYPRVVIVRGKDLNSKLSSRSDLGLKRGPTFSRVFGPYTSGSALKEALKIIRRIFPFFDDKSRVKGRYEFYRQLGLAPQADDRKAYGKNIKNIKLFFEGKKSRVIKNLEKEMKALAKEHKFERAGIVRNQIFSLKHIRDVALIKDDSIAKEFSGGQNGSSARGRNFFGDSVFRIEAYDIAHMSGKNMVGVMTVILDGQVDKNQYRKFKIRGFTSANDTGALLEVLERRFSHPEWPLPKLIVVDGGKAQINTALKFQERVGLRIPVVSVVKNERHKPKGILGNPKMAQNFEKEILLVNSEAHRFSIAYHRLDKRLMN